MKLETLYFKDGSGWSTNTFPDLDSEQTLIIVFADPKFINHAEPIQELAAHYPNSKMIGCSSAGEIIGSSILDNGLSVAICKFEKTIIKTVTVPIESSDDSFISGKKIATHLDKNDLCGIFVLSEGININGSELALGLNSIHNKNVIITGGLAGDGSQFKKTWMISNGKILANSISAVGFYGENITIGHGSYGGWARFGPERRITRSKGNILYELDGKPALDLYNEYLGDKADGLPATGLLFPLAIRKDRNGTTQLVRTILAVDKDSKSLTFAGDVPQGYLAQLMHGSYERLVSGANTAAKLALSNHKAKAHDRKSPLLMITISGVGRRLLLGDRSEEETKILLNHFPENTYQVGFYSYGELSPYSKGDCDLNNQTMTITTITEEV